MAIWVVVFLGPLIAIGIIAAMIKAAQTLLSSEDFVGLLLSRPVSVAVMVLTAVVGVVAAFGVIQLWGSAPWAVALLAIVVLANGSAMWGLWFRHRDDDAVRFPEHRGDSRGGDLAP